MLRDDAYTAMVAMKAAVENGYTVSFPGGSNEGVRVRLRTENNRYSFRVFIKVETFKRVYRIIQHQT
jgi:hypothetical protein